MGIDIMGLDKLYRIRVYDTRAREVWGEKNTALGVLCTVVSAVWFIINFIDVT